jgi:hypothetical protein
VIRFDERAHAGPLLRRREILESAQCAGAYASYVARRR